MVGSNIVNTIQPGKKWTPEKLHLLLKGAYQPKDLRDSAPLRKQSAVLPPFFKCGLHVNAGFVIKSIVPWVNTNTFAKNIMCLSLNLRFEVIWPGFERRQMGTFKKFVKKAGFAALP